MTLHQYLDRYVPAHLAPRDAFLGEWAQDVAGFAVYVVPELSERTGRVVEWEDWVAIRSGATCDVLPATPENVEWTTARAAAMEMVG